MGKKDKRERGGGVARRELPQAAPVDDSDLEPDEDDIAFVAKHRTYGAFFGDRLSVDAISTGSNKKRKKAIADEDKTQAFERGSRVAGAWEGGDGADDDDGPQPLALPVKRLDGTVVHAPLNPAPIEGDDVDVDNLPAAARAAVEKARQAWDRTGEDDARDADKPRAKGKKALKADERANAIGADPKRREGTSEKWWDAKKQDEDDDDDEEENDDDDDASSDSDSDPAVRARRARASAAAALEAEMSAADRLESVRERVGAACQGVLEDPEGRWTDLREVAKLVEDRDKEVARVCALSMVLVFRDVCPGYRIRPPTEKELAMKVTKETQKLRDFEAGLLKMYQSFVRTVVRCGGGKKSRSQRGKGGPEAGVALKCLCALLEGLPHFNFRTDVLSALVPHLGFQDSAAAETVADAIAGAIRADKAGDLTLEALHMVAQLVKQTRCAAHPASLRPFLDIRFDEGALALEAQKKPEVLSRKQTRKKRAEEREAIRKGRAEKEKRRLDRERLRSFGHNPDSDSEEERDLETELDRDMEEASGRMDNAKKRKLQSRMLEATFEMYFRVLKNAASDSPARGIPLMTPALVGLGKFTHLISVNFMADLMEVFRRLLAGGALGVDQKARCLLTACEILSGHGEALQVDAGEFHRQLYAMLAQPSGGSRGWGSGGADAGGHVADEDADRGTLRVRVLQKFLGGYKQVDQGRVAAFAKRLAGAATTSEAGEAVGALGVCRQLLAGYPRARCLLENERVGTGVFDLDNDDPETAGGLSAVLWDVALLRNHYHPAVRAAAGEVAEMPLSGSVPPALGSHAPAELARLHSTTRGNFRPAIPPPRPGKRPRTSVLDRATSKGGEARALRPGKALGAAIAAEAKDEDASRERAARAIKRRFVEARLFGVNAQLRKTATRARRMAASAAKRVEERNAARRAEERRSAAAGKKKKTKREGDDEAKKTKKARRTAA